jgi:tetratricopeptide (TPR) repeat protein
LKGQVGELLMLRADLAVENNEEIGDALDYNRRAASCFGDDVPPIVLEQRAWLDERADGKRYSFHEYRKRARGRARAKTLRDRYLEACAHVHWREYGVARQLLEGVVREEPNNSWAWFLLGLCHEGLGRDQNAVNAYNVCVGLDPEFHGAYLNRGMAYLRQRGEGYVKAKADFDHVIRVWPDRPETYLDRALTRWGTRDLKGAIADLDAAQKRGIGVVRVYFMRAEIRRQAGDETGARRDEAEGMKRKPTDSLSWVSRGLHQLRRGKAKAALADFDQALKLDPKSLPALQNKVFVLADHLNRQEEANRVLDRLLELYPRLVAAIGGQAVVLARLKQRDRAHERIGEALALAPASDEVRWQAACVFAQTSRQVPADAETAFVYLRQAVNARFNLKAIETDTDLAPLRKKPGYRPIARAADRLMQADQLLKDRGEKKP